MRTSTAKSAILVLRNKIDPEKVDKELEEANFEYEDSSSDVDQNISFELSSAEESNSSSRRGNTFVGTPLYVSPEMLAHNVA